MARTNRCLCGVRHGGKISGAQEASLDEEGLLLSIFQSLPKISVVPKPKKPVRITEGAFRMQLPRARAFLTDSGFLGLRWWQLLFQGPLFGNHRWTAPASFDQVSQDKFHCLDHCSLSWLLPSVSGTLDFFLSCLHIISIDRKLQNGDGGFLSCLWASSLPVISSVPGNLTLTLAELKLL